jgi:rod shape-determining protein MreD
MKAKQAEPVHGLGPKLVPFLLTLLAAILPVVPIEIPDYAAVAPNFVLMSVYHWTLYRPDHLPYVALFLTGLFVDLLDTVPGAVFGLTPLLLLVARFGVLSFRRSIAGKSFPMVWLGFAALAALYGLMLCAGGSALAGALLDVRSIAFETVLTVGFFPVATWFLALVQRATLAPL